MDKESQQPTSSYFKSLSSKERALFIRSGKSPYSYVPPHIQKENNKKILNQLKTFKDSHSRCDTLVLSNYTNIDHNHLIKDDPFDRGRPGQPLNSIYQTPSVKIWRVKEKSSPKDDRFPSDSVSAGRSSSVSSNTATEVLSPRSADLSDDGLFQTVKRGKRLSRSRRPAHVTTERGKKPFEVNELSFSLSSPEVYLAPDLPAECTLPLHCERRIPLTRSDCKCYSHPLAARLISTHFDTNELLIFGKRLFTTLNGVFVYASSSGIVYATPVPENKFYLGYLAGNIHPSWLCYHRGRMIVLNRDPAHMVIKDVLKSKTMLSEIDWSHMRFYDPFFKKTLSAKEGWCWMKALSASSIHYNDIPTSSHIPARFLALYCPNVKVVFVGKYLHVSDAGTPLINLGYRRVGSNLQTTEGGVLDFADIEGNSCLKGAFEAAMRRPIFKDSSNLMINLDNAFTDVINQRFRDKKRPHIIVVQTLHENERDYLVSEVGDCFIEFRAGYRGSHSLLSAFRQSVNFKLSSCLQMFTVGSVGGSIKYHFAQCHPFTHVCSPIIEGRDGSRRWKDLAGYFKSTNVSGDLVDDRSDRFLNHLTSSFCSKRIQECSYPTTALHMVDVYDVPLIDFVTAMTAKGSIISYVAMIFPPELLLTDGLVNHIRCNITVERSGDFVTYFIGDAGETYTHRWSCIRDYFFSYGVRCRQGLYYNVELTEACGPYSIFCISLSKPGRYVVKNPQRHFKAWMSNMTKVRIVLNECYECRVVEHFVERDFANRFLLYLTTAAPNVEDRTFEYALSGLRAHRSTMIVGSKIVHSKIDIPTDLSVQLASSFLREAVNRRHSNRKALRPLGYLSNFMRWFFKWFHNSFVALKRWICRYDATSSLYDDLATGRQSFLEDCPNVISIDTSGPVVSEEFEFKLLDEIVEEAQAMVLQQVTATGELIKEEPLTHTDRPGLFGGGKGAWYDFLLRGEIDSWNCKVWRFLRRSGKFLNTLPTQLCSFTSALLGGSLLSWKACGSALFSVFNLFGKFLSTITSFTFRPAPKKKNDFFHNCLGFIEHRSKFLKGVSSLGSSLVKAFGKFLSNSGIGKVLGKAFHLQFNRLRGFLSDCVKPLLKKYEDIKHDLATSLMNANLDYDPTWLKPFSLPRVKHCLKKALKIVMSHPYVTPLPILILWGLYHVLKDEHLKEFPDLRGAFSDALKYVGRYRLTSTADALQVLIGVLASFKVGLPLVPIINIWKQHPVFEGIFVSHVLQCVGKRTLPISLLIEAYSVSPLSNISNMFSLKEEEQPIPPSVKIDIGINHCTLNKPEFLKRVLAGMKRDGKTSDEATPPQNIPAKGEEEPLQPLDIGEWDKARGLGKEKISPVVLSPRTGLCFEIGECSKTNEENKAPNEVGINSPKSGFELPPISTLVIAEESSLVTPVPTTEVTPLPENDLTEISPTDTVATGKSFEVVDEIYNRLLKGNSSPDYTNNPTTEIGSLEVVPWSQTLVGGVTGLNAKEISLPTSPVITARVKDVIIGANLGFLLSDNPLREMTKLDKFPRVVCGEKKYAALLEWMTIELRSLWLQLSIKSSLEGSGFVNAYDGKVVHTSKNRNMSDEHKLIKYPSSVEAFLNDHDYLKPCCLVYSLVDGQFYDTFSTIPVGSYPVYVLNYMTPAYSLLKCSSIFKNFWLFFDPTKRNIPVTLFNAVPGGGKTYSLKKYFEELHGEADVLTANRGSAAEIRDSFTNSSGWVENIKTIDSYLISYGSRTMTPSRPLLLDECFLIHPGQIECVVRLLRPTKIFLYGDRRQIPFINRVLGFKADYTNLSVEGMSMNEICVSYRCPADVCALLSDMQFPDGKAYSQPVKSNQAVPVVHSISHAVETLPTIRDLEGCDAILTFCQSEKEEVRKHIQRSFPNYDFDRVALRTVHESQGATYKNVLLVRTKWADDTVFSSLPHILVALSRHNTSLKYYCPKSCREKGVGKYVTLASKLTTFVASQSLIKHLV